MQYWCNTHFVGNGSAQYEDGYIRRNAPAGILYGSGYFRFRCCREGFSPAMLVTGVKLEEVVLNALLV